MRADVWHHDNDAHIDDLVAFLLLHSVVGDHLAGVSVVEGDCIMTSAIETFHRFTQVFQISNLHLGLGRHPVRNAFPQEWREISHEVNRLPIIGAAAAIPTTTTVTTAEAAIAHSASLGKLSLLATGPLTNIAHWLQSGANKSQLQQLVVMGGAYKVPGNVPATEHADGSAEWNFFSDPAAADEVLTADLPTLLVPLDGANILPVTDELLHVFRANHRVSAQIIYHLWHHIYRRYQYMMWDVVAVLIAIDPSIARIEEKRLAVIREGRAQGRLVERREGGRCRVVTSVDPAKAMAVLLAILEKYAQN